MVNIAEILKEIIEPVINADRTYKIELFDDLKTTYDQNKNWINQKNAIKVVLLNNQRRVVISTSSPEISHLGDMVHTTFNWFMDIYARHDDAEVMKDLQHLIDELKDKVIVAENGSRVYLTFSVPKPQVAELDNGVYMRTISFVGSGIITNKAMIFNDAKIYLSDNLLTTVLDWDGGLTATGDNYQLKNKSEVETIIDNYTNSMKLKLVLSNDDATTRNLFYKSLGDTVSPASFNTKIKFEIANKTIEWTKAKLLSINTTSSKGGIIILLLDLIKG